MGSFSVRSSPLGVPVKSPWKGRVDPKSDFLWNCLETLVAFPHSVTALPLSCSSSLGRSGDLSTCLLLGVGCPKQKRNAKYLR